MTVRKGSISKKVEVQLGNMLEKKEGKKHQVDSSERPWCCVMEKMQFGSIGAKYEVLWLVAELIQYSGLLADAMQLWTLPPCCATLLPGTCWPTR